MVGHGPLSVPLDRVTHRCAADDTQQPILINERVTSWAIYVDLYENTADCSTKLQVRKLSTDRAMPHVRLISDIFYCACAEPPYLYFLPRI